MKNKRGGKRPNAGRPNKNSVRRNITLPVKLDQFVKENNLSLSKLAQQKIREIMLNQIKVGQEIKANWDGKISKIVAIEEETVIYECYSYNNTTSKFNDPYFRDSKDTILREFTFVD